jgi:hypothetical protein
MRDMQRDREGNKHSSTPTSFPPYLKTLRPTPRPQDEMGTENITRPSQHKLRKILLLNVLTTFLSCRYPNTDPNVTNTDFFKRKRDFGEPTLCTPP